MLGFDKTVVKSYNTNCSPW